MPRLGNCCGHCKMENMHRLRILAVCAVLAAGSRVLPAADKGDAAKGKEVFEGQCGVCHNADSDEKKMGPGLKGLFKKDKLTNGKKPTEANIRAKIDDGGNGMPAYKDMLSDQEKDNVIAYLKTL
jgi:cytochrome c